MKTVIEMAREAGAIHIHENPREFAIVGNDSIKAFEALVRADEREACAKVCEGLWHIDGQFTADEFAAAIRARSNT
jgi:hypothetical protein